MGLVIDGINHTRFLLKKPKVMPRILRGLYRAKVLKQRVLRTVDWAPTYKCNAACKMCSARKLYDSERKELTLEQRKMVWKQAVKLGVIHTQFTGGEPLTKGIDFLCQAIRDLNPQHFLVSLITNAILLNEEWMVRLWKAGLDTLKMSLDSFDSEFHNSNRGIKNNHEKIMKLIPIAKKIGFNVCIGHIVDHNNLKDIQKMIEFTRKEGIVLELNPVSSPDCWTSDDFDMFRDEDWKTYTELLDLPNVRGDISVNFYGRRGCPSGERIYITPYGDVMGCPHVQISFGNVLEEPLEVIWRRLYQSPVYNNFDQKCQWAFNKDYYEKFVLPFEAREKRPISYKEALAIKTQ